MSEGGSLAPQLTFAPRAEQKLEKTRRHRDFLPHNAFRRHQTAETSRQAAIRLAVSQRSGR